MRYVDVWGVNLINATGHTIKFRWDEAIKIVSPSGTVLNAIPITDELDIGNITLIRTSYEGNETGYQFLRDVRDESIVVIGSIIAAIAYPGKVKSLVAFKGYKQLPPHERFYLHNKFRVFLRKGE